MHLFLCSSHWFKRLSLWLVCAGAAACGASKKPAAGTVVGNVVDRSMAVHSAVFAPMAPPPQLLALGVKAVTAVVLSDTGDACADALAGKLSANKQYLVLALAAPLTGVVDRGTYTVLDPAALRAGSKTAVQTLLNGGMSALLFRGDATCANTLRPSQSLAAGGTVSLENINLPRKGEAAAQGQACGSLTLSFGAPPGDSVSGHFNAEYCPALTELLSRSAQALATPDPAAAAQSLPCSAN
jgi:hypothetical protein